MDSHSESINILAYGDNNTRKTGLAGTLPGKTFWLVAEPGYRTAIRRGHKPAGGRRLGNSAMAWAAIDWLKAGNRYEKFDWIVLDGATTLDNRIRLAYAQEAFDLNPAKRQHRNLPDKPDYFNTQNFWKSWIPELVDMPVNLFITAHAFRTDKTENGELNVFPGFQGKVTETANSICGLMDCVTYMAINKQGDCLSLWQRYTSKNEVTYWASDKFGVLPQFITNPTMPEILERINA